MKKYLLSFIALSVNLFGQITIQPNSSIACDSLYCSVNLTVNSGLSPYTFTVFTPSCSSNYTFTSNVPICPLTFSCAGIYTITCTDANTNSYGLVTHSVGLKAKLFVPVGSEFNTICLGEGTSLYIPLSTNAQYTISSALWSNGVSGNFITVFPQVSTTYSYSALYTTILSRTCSLQGDQLITVTSCPGSDVGLAESEDAINFIFYPNPISEAIFIESKNSAINRISIIDSFGNLNLSIENPKLNEKINLSFLSHGIYFLNVSGKSGTKVFKIIKE